MLNNEKMRVLFLDFDGVLHPVSDTRYFLAGFSLVDTIKRGRLFRWTPILADLLDDHRDVKIIVHSTWRQNHESAELCAWLGPLADRFIGSTPRNLSRWESVEWLVELHHLTDYRILDDYPREFPEGLRELIICDSELGVFDEVVREQLREWLAGHGLRDKVLSGIDKRTGGPDVDIKNVDS